ncbi:MAG: type II toxin-antitoxin system VapC family toxin [Candidatus Sulfotelmatobacter sp.]
MFDRIQSLSREYGLTPYDAAYLDLAKANGLPLATLDQDLIDACGSARVEIL